MTDWVDVGNVNDIPQLGARVVSTNVGNIAIFRTATDSIFAIDDACPHKSGPLSQGIVHGTTVTCPLHNWNIDLTSGEALGADSGCTHVYKVKVENDIIFLQL